MPSQHECVAIAQTIFYVPAIPITFYVLIKNWPIGSKISRLCWLTLAVLALMRLAGGIIVIVRESNSDNFGLTIATVVLLNVGLIPLIMSTLGMIGIVLSSSSEKHLFIQKMSIIFRILFVTALSLLVAGAVLGLSGNNIGDRLLQVAYILFTFVILIIVTMIVYLHSQKHRLAPVAFTYLTGLKITAPFLILRVVYGLLSAFLDPLTWNPLVGSAVAFSMMALLPEYITIAVYEYLGFYRSRENAASL